MNIETHSAPHEFLYALYNRVHGFEPNLPSPSDLQMLGIQAFQVATTNDETIQFDPCFFLPHPERLLQKYPLDDSSGTSLSRPRTLRDPNPTLEDFLKDEDRDPSPDRGVVFTVKAVWKDEDRGPSPDPEAKLEDAKVRLKWALRTRDEFKDEWYTHADEVYGHVDQQVHACRKGPTGTFYLPDLAKVEKGRAKQP
ncbi:hypothetical protein VN97_g6032 [Penicillium thymicola]|uniref:Uncharacterized protein n=1 Tax=Penicillium thymicola TaxID=293382 RepID=A0AAI9THN5_PENTH|nr:hypothetical protein VN97_g6032 [Penicillium thymicola]